MRRTLALLTAAVLATLVAVATAALPQQGGNVDLRSQFDGRVKGQSSAEAVIGNVAGIGDFNGDGLGDMATIALDGGKSNLRVVFGFNGVPEVQLADDKQVQGAAGGVALTSARDVLEAAGVGDMNSDGIGDIVVGSCLAAPADDAGRAWVVFGRAGNATIDLDALGAGGFQIDGQTGQCLGSAVAGAGDVNADGIPDIVLGAPKHDGGKGAAVVVFGKRDAAPVNAAAAGYTMTAPVAGDQAGFYVAGVGDVNGDGRADTAVGASGHSPASGAQAGAVWVVFGRVVPGGTSFPLGSIGPSGDTNGFRIDGPREGAGLGPVSGAGDPNGDGKAEVAVGAPGDDSGAESAGSVAVVFGKADAVEVATGGLGDRGYRFVNTVATEQFGAAVRGGQDLDGDGVPDIAAGAPASDPNSLKDAGSIFVLDGRISVTGGSADDTLGLGPENGYRVAGPRPGIDGSQTASFLGRARSIGLGDVNGDGRPDLLSGVDAAALAGGGFDPGTVFVTLGFGQPAFRVPATYAFTAGAPATPVAPTDVKRTGAATFSITPALPEGLVLDPATGAISGTPKEESAARQYTLKLTDLAGETARGPSIVVGPGPDTVAPVISRARLKYKKFRVGSRPTAISSAKKKKAPFGTVLRMNLSEAASLKIAVACAKPIRGKRKAFCKKKITARKATFSRRVGKGGDTVFSFSGRIGKKTRLLPGKYTFTVVATDLVKLVSKPVRVKFEVVK